MSGVKVHVVQNQFGQAALKQILIDLGGKATSQQLSAEAKARYPDSKLCEVVSIRMNHLRAGKEASQSYDKITRDWYWVLMCRFCNTPWTSCKCGAVAAEMSQLGLSHVQ